jgi:uncharacterized protein YraI
MKFEIRKRIAARISVKHIIGILLTVLLSACGTATTATPVPTTTKVAPTKTLLPRSTSTPQPVVLDACVTNSTIRVRSGPGKEYEVIGGMVSGTCMSLSGRNEESDWVYMISEDNKTGWVSASLLTIEGNVSRLSVRSALQPLSLVPTTKVVPTQKLPPTATRRPITIPTNTKQPLLSRFVPLCSNLADQVGERVSCQIPRVYCDYRPDVNGSPTFCNDRPYPNQDFLFVVFGDDWSDFDGECLIVSGYLETYRGVLQILASSRSQVSYC